MSNILIIDDEPNIVRMVSIALTAEGHHCNEAGSVKHGLLLAVNTQPDLIILDLGLPDGDGKDVLKRLRETSKVPVLVLSARHAEEDKVSLLSLGANDYVSKPFGIKELVARVNVLLRDFSPLLTANKPIRRFKNITLDTVESVLSINGNDITLSPKELQIIDLLLHTPNTIISQQQLIRAVWGIHHSEDAHYLRILISQLRKKLNRYTANNQLIETVPGRGYRFHIDNRE
ncbi:response regulator [Alteromonas sp. A081]|uniref:response regulator n=1 Tax=Alteromonas sp. A081 TaxID=3410269 RepID=UPI003B984B41